MSRVVIEECKSYGLNEVTEKINTAVGLLGGWGNFIKPGMKVLLKVNLLGPRPSDSASVTHCDFVRALAGILKAEGCTVWIGDSSGGAVMGGTTTARSFKAAGLEKVAAEEGAELKNFDREGAVEIKTGGADGDSLFIAKPMFDADFVINLPKFKTHMFATYTGAVKNLFGCIPGLKKAYYHKTAPDPEAFGAVIADINLSVRAGLHIMDAVTAMDGAGPTAGNVYNAGKILASTDSLALDSVACRMAGLNIENLPIFKASIKKGVGEWRPENIRIMGDYSEPPVLKGFKLPRVFAGKKSYSLVAPIVDFLKTRPEVEVKLCKHCNMCVESCPVRAIDRETKRIDYGKCIECLCCHELCMHKAVRLKRKNIIAGLLLHTK